MAPWQPLALAGAWLIYLFLAILRSAASSLSSVALERILAEERRSPPATSLGIRVAFDALHHLLLICGALLLLSALEESGVRAPYVIGFTLLGLSVLVAQAIGRLVAVTSPERAFSTTWSVAVVAYRPVEILARPFLSALERLGLSSRRGRLGEVGAEAELDALIDVGRREGILEAEEGLLIRQVVEFHDAIVREVMTPRTEIVAIHAEATLAELRDLMAHRRHSRVPVFRGEIDRIEGLVHLKDLLGALRRFDPDGPIGPIVHDAFFVPETKQVADLLREFQSRKVQIAVVVDEYGGTAGVVTVEDLLEEIVGEIQEEQDREEPDVSPDGEGSYLVRGSAPVDMLNDVLGADLPAEGYETVAGLIFNDLGRIPRPGEVIEHDDVRLEVVEANRRSISLIRASKRTTAARSNRS